ncbi:MAG: hypothetical protein IJC07_02885 [Clostridia bacterium]|nr:hypothetical protein [Clostridia bacterium]
MKKFLTRIMGCALALGIVCTGLVGCKDKGGEWDGAGFTDGGAVESVGGFVASTENYIYYINGIADPENNNEYGNPVKGTLMAANKKDLSDTKIVVPQMYTATDYGAGVFIDNGYAYYGTSNTEKNSSGDVANRELVFSKVKLGGGEPEILLNVGDLDVEYRIVKGGDTVYIVYYDDDDSAIKSFNTSTKEEIVVAKQDAKSSTNYSLKEYKFVETGMGSVAVVFTLTVYAEPYIEEKDKDDYQRLTELYNYVYVYSAGDAIDGRGVAGKVVLGQDEQKRETFTLTNVYGKYLLASSTDIRGNVKYYLAKTSEILNDGAIKEIKNNSYVSDTAFIADFDEAYVTENSKIYKVSLTGDDKLTKKAVALADDVSEIINVIGNDIYYQTKATEIVRIEMNNEDANKEYVTSDLIATSWYAPEFITIEGKTYLFYNDSSTFGAGYTKYVDLAGEVTGEDTDDDGEEDKFSLLNRVFLGKLSQTDRVAIATAKVAVIENSLTVGVLPMETDENGKFFNQEVIDARKAYNELTDSDKESYTEETLKTLEKYEKAIQMANEFNKLSGMYGYENRDLNEQTKLRTTYFEIKDAVIEFMKSEDYNDVSKLIDNNVEWYFSAAHKEFDK